MIFLGAFLIFLVIGYFFSFNYYYIIIPFISISFGILCWSIFALMGIYDVMSWKSFIEIMLCTQCGVALIFLGSKQ